MSDHSVHPGNGLSRFGETWVVAIRRYPPQLHLKRRDLEVERQANRGSASIKERLGPQRLSGELSDHVLIQSSRTPEDQLAYSHAAIAVRLGQRGRESAIDVGTRRRVNAC